MFRNVWINETMLIVYITEHFPFNAQQNVCEYHYLGVWISENICSLNKRLLTIVPSSIKTYVYAGIVGQ